MIIYNTTYTVDINEARSFAIWITQHLIPETEKTGLMRNPQFCQILSHKEQDTECFSLQWEADDASALHKYYTTKGASFDKELRDIFKDKAVAFPTLMEKLL